MDISIIHPDILIERNSFQCSSTHQIIPSVTLFSSWRPPFLSCYPYHLWNPFLSLCWIPRPGSHVFRFVNIFCSPGASAERIVEFFVFFLRSWISENGFILLILWIVILVGYRILGSTSLSLRIFEGIISLFPSFAVEKSKVILIIFNLRMCHFFSFWIFLWDSLFILGVPKFPSSFIMPSPWAF